jgi:hypothetical protein
LTDRLRERARTRGKCRVKKRRDEWRQHAGCLADVLAGTLAALALGTKVPRRWRRFPMKHLDERIFPMNLLSLSQT